MAKQRWGWASWGGLAALLLAGCGVGYPVPGPTSTPISASSYPLYGHATDFTWIAGQVVVRMDPRSRTRLFRGSLFRYTENGQEVSLAGPGWEAILFESRPRLGAYVILFGHLAEAGAPCRMHDINQTPCYFVERIEANPQFPDALATPTPDPRWSMPPPTFTPPMPTPTRDPALPSPGPTINGPVLTAQVVPPIGTVAPPPLPTATPLPSPTPLIADATGVLAISVGALYGENHGITLKVGQTLQLSYEPDAYGILLDWTMQLTTAGPMRLMKTDSRSGAAWWTYRAMQPGQTILRATTDAVCHQAPQPCGWEPSTSEFAITVR